jgi:hypothetical protein
VTEEQWQDAHIQKKYLDTIDNMTNMLEPVKSANSTHPHVVKAVEDLTAYTADVHAHIASGKELVAAGLALVGDYVSQVNAIQDRFPHSSMFSNPFEFDDDDTCRCLSNYLSLALLVLLILLLLLLLPMFYSGCTLVALCFSAFCLFLSCFGGVSFVMFVSRTPHRVHAVLHSTISVFMYVCSPLSLFTPSCVVEHAKSWAKRIHSCKQSYAKDEAYLKQVKETVYDVKTGKNREVSGYIAWFLEGRALASLEVAQKKTLQKWSRRVSECKDPNTMSAAGLFGGQSARELRTLKDGVVYAGIMEAVHTQLSSDASSVSAASAELRRVEGYLEEFGRLKMKYDAEVTAKKAAMEVEQEALFQKYCQGTGVVGGVVASFSWCICSASVVLRCLPHTHTTHTHTHTHKQT